MNVNLQPGLEMDALVLAGIEPGQHYEMPFCDPNSQMMCWVDRDKKPLSGFYFAQLPNGMMPLPGEDLKPNLVELPDGWLCNSVLLTSNVRSRILAVSNVAEKKHELVLIPDITSPGPIEKRVSLKVTIESMDPERKVRTNDWRVTKGGLPIGMTMHQTCEEPQGACFIVGPDGKPIRLVDGLTVGNGAATLKNGKRGYVDTPKGFLVADCDPSGPTMSQGEVLCPFHKDDLVGVCTPQLEKYGGFVGMDGICLGTWKGREVVFGAMFNGGCVVIFDPITEEILGVIETPGAALTTACCFGTKRNDVLFITTSNEGLDVEAEEGGKNSGKIFWIDLSQHEIVGYRENVVNLSLFSHLPN